MLFVSVTKNGFFTHFRVDGTTFSHREADQIWNAGGLQIKVQGSDWTGAYNGFGKRHLVTSTGGKHDGMVDGGLQKMKNLAAKRSRNPAQPRQKKFNQFIGERVPRTNYNMKDAAGRTLHQTDKTSAEGVLRGHYVTDPYGPNTSICTVLLMDGLTPAAVGQGFVDAITAVGAWAANTAHQIAIDLGPGRIYQVQANGTVDPKDVMLATAHFDGAIYHVYHCNGALP